MDYRTPPAYSSLAWSSAQPAPAERPATRRGVLARVLARIGRLGPRRRAGTAGSVRTIVDLQPPAPGSRQQRHEHG